MLVPGLMYGLISTLPVSPPPLVSPVAVNSGSVWAVSAASVIPLTGPVVWTGSPLASTSWNEAV